jgi:integrating conjugative element protein (TIGR03761 family)
VPWPTTGHSVAVGSAAVHCPADGQSALFKLAAVVPWPTTGHSVAVGSAAVHCPADGQSALFKLAAVVPWPTTGHSVAVGSAAVHCPADGQSALFKLAAVVVEVGIVNLDTAETLVQNDVAGEGMVQSAGLATAHVNQPAKTAMKKRRKPGAVGSVGKAMSSNPATDGGAETASTSKPAAEKTPVRMKKRAAVVSNAPVQRSVVPSTEAVRALLAAREGASQEELAERARSLRSSKLGADRSVTVDEARRVLSGKTPRTGEATLALHTKHAFRLFMGRDSNPDGHTRRDARIFSAKSAAGCLTTLNSMSMRDNPFADLALVQIERKIGELKAGLELALTERKARLEWVREETGISYSLANAPSLMTVPILVSSVYGHRVIQCLGLFDRVVRYELTLTEIGDRLVQEREKHINEQGRPFRGLFEFINHYFVIMNIAVHASLNRASLTSASVETRRVVRELVSRFPQTNETEAVLLGTLLPSGKAQKAEMRIPEPSAP